jgi:ABC-type uncharacterized transport system permease subunit
MILSSPLAGAGSAEGALALGASSAAALVVYLASALLGEGRGRLAGALLVLAWLAHGAALAIDILGLGSPTPGARFGFGPVLSITAWLVLAVYAIEHRFVPIENVRRALAIVAAAAVALGWFFPGEMRPHPSSPWAPLHWMLGVASYTLFAAAVLHGALLNRAEHQLREHGRGAASGVPLLRLERLTFHFVAAGFVMLSAALLAGMWFARPWRWDHKTVFSVLGWFVFAALLVGRHAFGWRGAQATRWLYTGATLLLLAYVGSRFVFEVVLQRAP